MKKLIFILLSVLMFSGCADQSEDEKNVAKPSDTGAMYSLSGYAQDGPCLSGGDVTAYPLSESNLERANAIPTYQTVTINDFGQYSIGAEISERYIEVFVNASCHNEVTGGLMLNKTLSAIIDMSADSANNVSPMTTIRSPRLRELYNDSGSPGTYLNFQASSEQAESEILTFFDMPSLDVPFTDLNLVNDSTGDAVLVAANSMMLWGKVEAEQTSFMTDIGDAIRLNGSTGTIELKNELKLAEQSLNVVQIKTNLESRYVSLGYTEMESPWFWNIIDSDGDGIPNASDPDSFVELMDRTPTILGGFNLEETRVQSLGDGSVHYFALPYIFDSSISTAKYIGISWDADYMTIYDNNEAGCDGFDCPGSQLFTINKIQDNFFAGSHQDTTGDTFPTIPQNFTAAFGDDHPPVGQKVWIVMHKDEDYNPMIGYATSGSPIQFTAFSRNHFSDDGINWYPTGTNPIFTTAMWRAFWTN